MIILEWDFSVDNLSTDYERSMELLMTGDVSQIRAGDRCS